jgi:hypothetical protein
MARRRRNRLIQTSSGDIDFAGAARRNRPAPGFAASAST